MAKQNFYFFYFICIIIVQLLFNVHARIIKNWTDESDFIFPEWIYEEENCRTPDQVIGSCIQASKCGPINEILENLPQPIPRETIQLLQKYQCGFDGNRPKVCCPPHSINLITKPQEPPDVSSHRNYHLLPHDCGFLDTGDKIVNGNKTALFEFPWMALLSYKINNNKQDFRCGATIINERYIMTAAHCLYQLKYPLVSVRIGDHDYGTDPDCEVLEEGGKPVCSPPYQDLDIEQIIIHPEFSSTKLAHDIGLIRVRKMRFNNRNIRPVCLPIGKARNYNFTNRNLIVTGWGITENYRPSSLLLKAEIPNVPLSECKEIYKDLKLKNNRIELTHRQLCAGGKTKSDSCSGDSGGPLHAVSFINGDSRYVQQGIVSLGPIICGSNTPALYTRVAYYMDWILDQLKP